MQLAALIARYHRRSSPKPIHEGYATLDWESRTNVVKLAAILRLADALDRNNSQRVKGIHCAARGQRWVISVPGADDLSVEQLAVQQKAGLFKEVYGMSVLVRNAPETLERRCRGRTCRRTSLRCRPLTRLSRVKSHPTQQRNNSNE